MSQMPDLGAMSAQPSMDAAALVADQHASVYRGPAGLYNRAKIVTRLQSNYRSACKTTIFTIIVTSGRILGKGCNGQQSSSWGAASCAIKSIMDAERRMFDSNLETSHEWIDMI